MDLRFHLHFLCGMRRMTCRHDGCSEVFPVAQQDEHERNECALKDKRDEILAKAAELNLPTVNQ